MMKTTAPQDRQADERRTVSTGDDISGRRQFADIKFDVAHHASKRADLWLDRDELGIHALNGNGTVADSRGMRMLSDCDFEWDFLGQLNSPWDFSRRRPGHSGGGRIVLRE